MSPLRSDISSWQIGPYHALLPVPIRLDLKLDGEAVISGVAEGGFLHRGLEKAMEVHSWNATVPYADRLDPEGAAFAELVVCLAVEEIGDIQVPDRAKLIRVVLCELNRIASHQAYIARVAYAVGGETIQHFVLRDRERVLDLFELLTGARFTLNFLCFGGVRDEVTEGFIERVLETCEAFRYRLREYNELFTTNETFMRRTRGIGVITKDTAIELGITGPNARAIGIAADTRKQLPYSGYDRLDLELIVGDGTGDAYGRFTQRLAEVDQSVGLLRQALDRLPSGSHSSRKLDLELKIPRGEAFARVESARGLLGCHVVSDGSLKPSRVQFRPAAQANFQAVPRLLESTRLEDLPLILASLDLAMPEVDR